MNNGNECFKSFQRSRICIWFSSLNMLLVKSFVIVSILGMLLSNEIVSPLNGLHACFHHEITKKLDSDFFSSELRDINAQF